MSDLFIHGTNKGNVFLLLWFQGMIIHEIIPDSLLLGTITPFPKKKNLESFSVNRPTSYRSLIVSSVLGKILDTLQLQTNSNVLNNFHLQFGFQKNHSTTQCTFLAQEVINYNVSNKSSVYCVLLDTFNKTVQTSTQKTAVSSCCWVNSFYVYSPKS